jgi:hypothetical protein
MPVEYSDWPKEFIASMMNEMQNEFIVPSDSEVVEYWIHSDLSGIIGISCQWDELLTASRCNQAFGSPEWYLASCHFYGPLKPYLAVAARGPKLVCILPLELDLRNGVVTFPHRENDYNDILVRDGDLGTAGICNVTKKSLPPDDLIEIEAGFGLRPSRRASRRQIEDRMRSA